MELNGKHVIHKTLGLGTIFNRTDNMISVHFPDAPDGARNSTFIIPSAFDSGFLKVWDKETQIALEETITESTCSVCGKWVTRPEPVEGKCFCSKCKKIYTRICESCGKRYLLNLEGDSSILDFTYKSLCPDCSLMKTFVCKKCNHRYLLDRLVDRDYVPKYKQLCEYCVKTCGICGKALDEEHAKTLFPERSYYRQHYYCPDCYPLIVKSIEENRPIKNRPSKKHPLANVVNGETLYIYKGQIVCRQKHHTLIAATGILCTKRGEEIRLDIQYCMQCKRYLMEYTSYQYYRRIFGVLIGNIKMIGSGFFDGELPMAEESPLKLCGYNVSQAEGLTESERHYILAKMIHNGIVSKTEAIRYLEHFINMNGAKEGNELARSKWKNDLAFVHSYRIDTQPEVYITSVERY